MKFHANKLAVAVAGCALSLSGFSQAQQLEEVVVTAAKVEASIQDTPIAVTAFTQQALDSQLINDASALQFSVPNLNQTKGNFTAGDIRIRGIGSGAVGTFGDSGVGIHVNGIYQVSTRIFETQFLDMERVEVLRGPQGTLYGRNTTGGVMNLITAKADPTEFSASVDATIGNYGATQGRFHINTPLSDTLALRVAGMSLERDGFTTNEFTGNDVDDRSLWSGRLSLTWDAGEDTQVNFMYSSFEEDDSRMRSQKQACNTDPAGILGCLPGTPTYGVANSAGGIAGSLMNTISSINGGVQGVLAQAALGVYSNGVPIGNPANASLIGNVLAGTTGFSPTDFLVDNNPDDRRTVNMDFEPTYFAEEEMFQLQITHDAGDLTYSWSTGYTETAYSSTEDYEKGVATADWQPTLNTFVDLGNATALTGAEYQGLLCGAAGVPAVACGIAGQTDVATLGPATGLAALAPFMVESVPGSGTAIWAGNSALLGGYGAGVPYLLPDGTLATASNAQGADESYSNNEGWSHEFRVQSNYDGNLNFMVGAFKLDYEGRNRYVVRSSGLAFPGQVLPIDPRVFPAPFGAANPHDEVNPHMQGYENDTRLYELDAQAIFGELYYDVSPDLRLTLGARYSDETKKSKQRTIYVTFADLPPLDAENNAYGFPEYDQDEFTWKANATYNMSDDTMVYGTLSSSFKSGGVNPISVDDDLADPAAGGDPANLGFAPEFVDAIEIGMKTTFMDGAAQFNGAFFYYDYKDMQQSKIVSVTSLNQNSDAEITGFEGEFRWAATENLELTANVGWVNAELGEYDTVDTANPNALGTTQGVTSVNGVNFITPYVDGSGNLVPVDYSRCDQPEPFPCAGYRQSLKGNQIALTPEFNYNLGAIYRTAMGGMPVIMQTNYYWQDKMYTTNFNSPSNEIEDWSMWNANARVMGENWYAEAWVRNIMDDDNITGGYLTSSVSSLFTNQFILEPRTFGLTVGMNF
ncbi:TonB-dependent receptor [Luminiphilus sp.]|nr:TonB-dependent receptor [Luminiphilus sp.]